MMQHPDPGDRHQESFFPQDCDLCHFGWGIASQKAKPMKKAWITLLFAVFPVGAQAPISLQDAVHLALDKNKSVEAANASTKSAEMRISEARSGLLPKVNYSESWATSDNPVFVFSSLLTQHQFGAQNFEIGALNQPNFLNNFQSQLTADQVLYGAGQTKHAVRSAELTKDITSEEGRRTQMDVIAGVVRTYYDSLLSADQLAVTAQAMRSAEADRLPILAVVALVMVAAGFDPVWIGVFVTIMVEIGMLTPPVGVNLFIMLAITRGKVSMGELSTECLPYWMMLLVGTVLMTVFPQIALFLPQLFH